MYDALDVAEYIINYSNEKNIGVSNLKLQKLLYLVQAFFLIDTDDGRRCFAEPIEAWGFGPVVPKVYYIYEEYGSTDIPCMYDTKVIKGEDVTRIKGVINTFKDYSATDLVQLTINQAPWKNAYDDCRMNIITPQSIKKYFTENLDNCI